MSVLSENLRYLRFINRLSQRQLAEKLIIGRGRYSKYEDGVSEPPLEIMRRIAGYYHISIDLLISADLHEVPAEEIRLVESIICKFR